MLSVKVRAVYLVNSRSGPDVDRPTWARADKCSGPSGRDMRSLQEETPL